MRRLLSISQRTPAKWVGWMDTGERVGKQYMELRREAIEHAQIRNRLFQEATQAYLNGFKAAAKELSQK